MSGALIVTFISDGFERASRVEKDDWVARAAANEAIAVPPMTPIRTTMAR